MRVLVLAVCCAFASAPAIASAASVRLAGGIRVAVTRSGAFALSVGGRELLANASGAALTARQFTDVVTSSQTGQWSSFSRDVDRADLRVIA
jgi:hypothetical protein